VWKPVRPSTVACRNASPVPSDNSTKPKPFSDLNHLTTAVTGGPEGASNCGARGRGAAPKSRDGGGSNSGSSKLRRRRGRKLRCRMRRTAVNDVVGGFKWVGTRPIRPDGVPKVTGRALYAADYTMAGALVGKILRSPHAHARIRSIDTSKAAALPGVRAVITA